MRERKQRRDRELLQMASEVEIVIHALKVAAAAGVPWAQACLLPSEPSPLLALARHLAKTGVEWTQAHCPAPAPAVLDQWPGPI